MKRFDGLAMFLAVMAIPFIDAMSPLGLGAFAVVIGLYTVARRAL